MRFVLTSRLKEGATLGEPLKSTDGKILLNKGEVLSSSYISKIQKFVEKGVIYIRESPEDTKLLSKVRFWLKNDLIDMITKSAYKMDSIQSSPRTFSAYKNERDIIDEILANDIIVSNMADLFELDIYSFRHSVNTAAFSYIVGLSLKMYGQDLYDLLVGALLHDIGKIFIRPSVLNKPGRLTEKEFEEMKQHTFLGCNLLGREYNLPEAWCIAALEHHERFDRSGYPLRKSGKETSLIGRIVGIADAYAAMTADRPFRSGMLASNAMEYIMGGAGTLFDPQIARLFSQSVMPFPVGTIVKLSNGSMGVVVQNYSDCCTRPKVRIGEEGDDSQIVSYIVDLKNDPELKNTTIVRKVTV